MRKRGRPRRKLADQLSLDMEILNLKGDMTLDRATWRPRIEWLRLVLVMVYIWLSKLFVNKIMGSGNMLTTFRITCLHLCFLL